MSKKPTSMLHRSIREYCATLLDSGNEIVHRDAAQAYIQDHGDVIGFEIEAIVEDHIAASLKEQSQQPAPPIGQDVLFDLPAAITVADGITKPLKACTWHDLKVGRGFKVDNVKAAQAALDRYDYELARLEPVMADEPLRTVAEAARILAGAA